MIHLTYLNNSQLKSDFLAEITKHEEADAFIKGTYARMNGTFKGCAIGCALHSLNVLQGKVGSALVQRTDQHSRYEAELGLPTWFAYLEDQIFENLSGDLSKTWPRRLAEAIPVGAVVDHMVLAKILRWMLADPEFGVRYATDDVEIRGHIDSVIVGFDAEISTGGNATAEQREAFAKAAWAVAEIVGAVEIVGVVMASKAVWTVAKTARDAWAAWVIGGVGGAAVVARAAWDVATSSSHEKADAFFPAFSEFVLNLVQELPVIG